MPAPDSLSGSSDVATALLERLERFVATDVSADAASLRHRLLGWLRAEQAGQPSMALIHNLCGRALDVADTAVSRGDTAPGLRASLAASCAAERQDLAASLDGVGRTAAALLTANGAWIATLSHSRAVFRAFATAARQQRSPSAIVAEGRPLLEGRAAAAELAALGLRVWIVADAALPLLASQASMVWIGADAVTERGIINKIGSYAMALAAREHGVPVYALASRRKFLSAATGALRILEMPSDELWETPADGVQARNLYFEQVPLELLRAVVVEDGALGASEAAQLARERQLPGELRGA